MNLLKRVENFIKGLEELCKEHGIYIDSCGCCNSPWLEDAETHERLADNLYYEVDGTITFEVV